MDKDTLTEFIVYCDCVSRQTNKNRIDKVSHIYEKYGREFIHNLPIEHRSTHDSYQYTVIRGTYWIHSVVEPVYNYYNKPIFHLLGQRVSLDEWLPLSALSPEDITLFKLKYA